MERTCRARRCRRHRPVLFFDDNGKAYIVHKAEEHSPVKWSNNRALAIIEFDTKTGKTIGEPRKFREEGVGPEEQLERNEGAHIYKIDGNYYLLAAEGAQAGVIPKCATRPTTYGAIPPLEPQPDADTTSAETKPNHTGDMHRPCRHISGQRRQMVGCISRMPPVDERV